MSRTGDHDMANSLKNRTDYWPPTAFDVTIVENGYALRLYRKTGYERYVFNTPWALGEWIAHNLEKYWKDGKLVDKEA